jgi:uridine kinase
VRAGGAGVTDATGGAAEVRLLAGCALAARPRLGRVRLVAVDGPAGSGKTTLARRLADELVARGRDATVLHLDDLYEGWTGLEGGLWPRLTAQVLEPLRRGLPGRYQRYDWVAGAFDGWVDVPVPDVLVLEGCGSARREAAPFVVLTAWVEASPEVRLARGLARDGEAARPHWERWMRDEAAHFDRERTAERADFRLDGFGRMGA